MRAKSVRSIVLMVLFLLLSAGTVLAEGGAALSFAPALQNAAPCTIVVEPGASIQKAISPARSGAVICVRGGVYVEALKIIPVNTGITLMAYPGEKPIIDGANRLPVLTAKNKFAPLLLVNARNVTVDGLEIRRSNMRGITVSQGDVILRNLIVRDSKSGGVVVNGTATAPLRNVLLENSVVTNNLLNNVGGAAGGSAVTFTDVENGIARGNVIYHNYGEGLVSDRRARNSLLEGNTSFDNRGANIYLVNTVNPTVRNNFIFCTDDPISWRGKNGMYRPGPGLQVRDENFKAPQPPPSSGQVIVNNIVVGCGVNFGVATQIAGGGLTNALVAHNTFVNARSVSGEGANNIEIGGNASLQNTRFVNNMVVQTVPGTIARILYSIGTPNLSTFLVSNNLYTRTPANGWVSSEPGRIVADARLVNPILPLLAALPTPANYALTAASPAIDAGAASAGIGQDFFGDSRSGAVDIGADELGGSTQFNFPNNMAPLPAGE